MSASEIQELERAGILSSRTVLVHGVGIDRQSLQILLRRGVSLVWCPSSNLFTLSQTLRPDVLRSNLPICLGTDSALTGQGDMACELTVARKTSGLTAEEIYPMVTTRAARTLHLNRGEGEIREGGVADLLVVPDYGQTPAQALQQLSPALVIVRGRIQLVSSEFASRIDPILTRHLQKVELDGRGTWLINANVSVPVRRDGSRSRAGFQAGWKAGAGMNPVLDSLPVLILYPHSRCNCRCVMCDIWKTDSTLEISPAELERHAEDIARLRVEWVVFSGGEPLMHSDLFRLCRFLQERNIRTTLLSTGLLIERHADQIVDCLDDVIVSLEAPRKLTTRSDACLEPSICWPPAWPLCSNEILASRCRHVPQFKAATACSCAPPWQPLAISG